MVNVPKLFREFLLSTDGANGIPALTTKVYFGTLPKTYDPAAGPAIQFFVRGGSSEPEMPVEHPSIQLRIWAAVGAYSLAQKVYRAVHDWAHGQTFVVLTEGVIMSCLETGQGQDGTDPETGWATVLTFFEVIARS